MWYLTCVLNTFFDDIILFFLKIIVHPNYNTITLDNDIALIRLSNPISFPSDNEIAPICMPKSGEDFTGKNAIVTKWGASRLGK